MISLLLTPIIEFMLIIAHIFRIQSVFLDVLHKCFYPLMNSKHVCVVNKTDKSVLSKAFGLFISTL